MTEAHNQNYLQRLVHVLGGALEPYGSSVKPIQLESWAVLIHECMSGKGRDFHNVQHVFDVAGDSDDPLFVLAAVFHDTIYYRSDGGLSPAQAELIGPVIVEQEQGVTLRGFDAHEDPCLAIVASVFGFSAGQVLPAVGGLNEFLSAVLAARCLGEALPLAALAELSACIEATIPFRGLGTDGSSAAEQLHHRLKRADQDFALGLTEQGLARAVHRAVALANNDVGNFADEDVAWFLDNTWKLLPESNAALRFRAIYRVSEFQLALSNMERFFTSLDPNVVFCSFQGCPTDTQLAALTAGARRNLSFGRAYLRAKLAALALLGALAEKTGGDVPLSLFTGDLHAQGHAPMRLEDQLGVAHEFVTGCQPKVYELLVVGRYSETNFDLRHSPLSAFLYARLGDSGIDKALAQAVHPMTFEQAQPFLDALPKAIVSDIARASARIATSRADALHALV